MGSSAIAVMAPPRVRTDAAGWRLIIGTLASTKLLITSRFSSSAAALTRANPCHCSGVSTPSRVWCWLASQCPKEPDPWPQRILGAGWTSSTSRSSWASCRRIVSLGVARRRLSVIRDPPSFTKNNCLTGAVGLILVRFRDQFPIRTDQVAVAPAPTRAWRTASSLSGSTRAMMLPPWPDPVNFAPRAPASRAALVRRSSW